MLDYDATRDRLVALDAAVVANASDVALFIVYDRASRVDDRPGLVKSYYAERCVTEDHLHRYADAFRSVGVHVEVFGGEFSFIEALVSGRLHAIDRRSRIVYNGLESGIAPGGFEPGRRALIPAAADAYGLINVGSHAHGCTIARHKFHYVSILRQRGLPVPEVWHYSADGGWSARQRPPTGERVIVKSTYESWSIGVTMESVFVVEEDSDQRVDDIARGIGQPVTVQRFVSGLEVCVPVFSDPERFTTPPREVVLTRAPDDPDAFVTIDDNLRAGAVSSRPFVSADVALRLDRIAIDAVDILGLRGLSRIDFRVEEGGALWITDVGADPGLDAGATAARSAADLGVDHASFLRAVIGTVLATSTVPPR